MLTETWSTIQKQALEEVGAWLATPKRSRPQVFRLFGYAGTGKTTLAKHLAATCKGLVLYACFTGKAALVLASKGCRPASTIHSLIYRAHQDPLTGEFRFKLNRDSTLAGAEVLIVDEVSMVNDELARDLLAFGVPVLVLGDPAQLPPVKGEGYFIDAEPDILLTEVHRQAADNPIISLSMQVRQGHDLVAGDYGQAKVVERDDLTDEMLLAADQVLCGINRTRHRLNRRLRELRGLRGVDEVTHPTVGDRLVCLRNNREKGLLNGSLWTVATARANGSVLSLRLDSIDEPGRVVDVMVREEFFDGSEESIAWRTRLQFDEFTFAQALTVHKAQGSEWDNVLLLDESMSFRENSGRWLYTGITRASGTLTVVQP